MTVLTSGAAGNLREQILSAAASCFRERGIKATKMQEIAKRAGISVGNFYNYFENKDAIIDEFAQREVARLAREIDEIVNGRVSMEEQRRQFRESLRKQLAVQRARVKIEIIEEAARNSSMGEIVKRSDAQVRELIKKMHRSRSSADVSDEEIEVMVEMDMALVDGMAFRLIAPRTPDQMIPNGGPSGEDQQKATRATLVAFCLWPSESRHWQFCAYRPSGSAVSPSDNPLS